MGYSAFPNSAYALKLSGLFLDFGRRHKACLDLRPMGPTWRIEGNPLENLNEVERIGSISWRTGPTSIVIELHS